MRDRAGLNVSSVHALMFRGRTHEQPDGLSARGSADLSSAQLLRLNGGSGDLPPPLSSDQRKR